MYFISGRKYRSQAGIRADGWGSGINGTWQSVSAAIRFAHWPASCQVACIPVPHSGGLGSACKDAPFLLGLTQRRIHEKRQLKWCDYISLELFNK